MKKSLSKLSAIALLISSSAAYAHPSMHHTGEEGIMHEALFAGLLIAAIIAGTAFLKWVKTKR